jgi:acetyltransferase-like isoleucine patch superfamily enzyme
LWVKEENRVFIGRDVTLDHDFPDRIVLHKGVQIVEGTKIFCHFRGPAEKVIFHDYSRTGPSCVVSAIKGQTLIIGKGAAIGPLSNVSKDIPPMTFCSSTPPAKPIATQSIPLTTNTVYEEWRKGLKKI